MVFKRINYRRGAAIADFHQLKQLVHGKRSQQPSIFPPRVGGNTAELHSVYNPVVVFFRGLDGREIVVASDHARNQINSVIDAES